MNNGINYSIIIPHKNIPDLLLRCITSVPKRDDLEIIIVDDNSSPDVVDFDTFPGLKNTHVKVIFTKDGYGAGFARNKGLEHAKGKWIIFADADDYFEKDFILLLEKYKDNNCDIIYFKVTSRESDTLKPANRDAYTNNVIDKFNTTGNEDILRYQKLEPWGKIINHDLIIKNNLKFDQTLAANDLMFSAKSGYYARKITADTIPGYCITVREGSLVKIKNKDVLDAKFDVIKNVNKFLFSISKGKYRINVYYYLWPYSSINKMLFFRKVTTAIVKGNIFYNVIDLFKSGYFFIKKSIK